MYVDKATALDEGLIETGDGWAVMRTGAPVWKSWWSDGSAIGWKRQSLKLETSDSWTYFLAAMHLTHSPVRV